MVLSDEKVRPDVVRKLTQAGATFAPPAFGQGKQSVSFLLLNPETYVLYRVQATRTAGGSVEVVKTKLLEKAPGTQSNSQVLQTDAIGT